MQHHDEHTRGYDKLKNKQQGDPLQKFLMQFDLEQADPNEIFKKLVAEIEILKGELAQ